MIALSVIIPFFNAEQYLERCVVSLMEQTLTDGIEYIFVNDCSTDDSARLLEAVLARYPQRSSQVSICSTPHNSGPGAARTLGIQQARGAYITHCDSDDWVSPDAYQSIVNRIDETDSDLILSDFLVEKNGSSYPVTYPDWTISKRLDCGLWWMLWSHTVKRSLLLKHQLTAIEGINFWEDMDLLMRVYHYAQSISYVHSPLYHYDCTNPQSLSKAAAGLSLFPSCLLVIEHLSSFYRSQQVAPPARLLALKQFARDLYLIKSPADWAAWRKLYPESWHYVWKDSTFKFLYRVTYTLASWGITFLFRQYLYCSHLKHR